MNNLCVDLHVLRFVAVCKAHVVTYSGVFVLLILEVANELLWHGRRIFVTYLYGSVHGINRGSCMSAHVLLNLLNELGKRDKMRGLPSILSLFRNEFNKFNNTRARMLDSIYHMTNTLKSHFWSKNVILLSYDRNVVMDVITFPVNR